GYRLLLRHRRGSRARGLSIHVDPRSHACRLLQSLPAQQLAGRRAVRRHRRGVSPAHPRTVGEALMAYRDLRDFLAQLEASGALKRVAVEVDPHLEITEICDRVLKSEGPALVFERPKGHAMPL